MFYLLDLLVFILKVLYLSILINHLNSSIHINRLFFFLILDNICSINLEVYQLCLLLDYIHNFSYIVYSYHWLFMVQVYYQNVPINHLLIIILLFIIYLYLIHHLWLWNHHHLILHIADVYYPLFYFFSIIFSIVCNFCVFYHVLFYYLYYLCHHH